MAWPPIWFCASTTMTEAPASRATIAAGIPVAPEPMTTISASRSHWDGTCRLSTRRPLIVRDAGKRRRETNSIADFVSSAACVIESLCHGRWREGQLRDRGTDARHRPHEPPYPRGEHEDDPRRRHQGQPARLQGLDRRGRSKLP